MKCLIEKIKSWPKKLKITACVTAGAILVGAISAGAVLVINNSKSESKGTTAANGESQNVGSEIVDPTATGEKSTNPTEGNKGNEQGGQATTAPTEKGTDETGTGGQPNVTEPSTSWQGDQGGGENPYTPGENPTPPEEPSQNTPTPPPPTAEVSSVLKVTVCAQVGPSVMVVAGLCDRDAEYVRVTGTGVSQTDIYPDPGSELSYFIGTVRFNKNTTVNVQVKRNGKELSAPVQKQVTYNSSMPDYMTSGEYMPVFGKNSRMHFYSALLCYSLSNPVSEDVKNIASQKISSVVNNAKAQGTEVIYLVVPSSAAVYPETVPDKYQPAVGPTLFSTFKSIAEANGATVIYPLETMTANKWNMKVFHNTDSHWSTYGAYLGLCDLMNYISQKFPNAKPRTMDEMGFYHKELYAGDALFSFPDIRGFERKIGKGSDGETKVTKLKELVPLYQINFATNTLAGVLRGNKSIYLDWGNGSASTEVNPNGQGLPTATIVRDSFGATVYDMLNDRFSEVHWQDSGEYKVSTWKNTDYLIYVVSERNLLKVMTESADMVLK